MTSTPGPLTPIWSEISAHESRLSTVHTRDLFAQDAGRYARFSRLGLGLSMDFSRQRIDQEALYKLYALADFGAAARAHGGHLKGGPHQPRGGPRRAACAPARRARAHMQHGASRAGPR